MTTRPSKTATRFLLIHLQTSKKAVMLMLPTLPGWLQRLQMLPQLCRQLRRRAMGGAREGNRTIPPAYTFRQQSHTMAPVPIQVLIQVLIPTPILIPIPIPSCETQQIGRGKF